MVRELLVSQYCGDIYLLYPHLAFLYSSLMILVANCPGSEPFFHSFELLSFEFPGFAVFLCFSFVSLPDIFITVICQSYAL